MPNRPVNTEQEEAKPSVLAEVCVRSRISRETPCWTKRIDNEGAAYVSFNLRDEFQTIRNPKSSLVPMGSSEPTREKRLESFVWNEYRGIRSAVLVEAWNLLKNNADPSKWLWPEKSAWEEASLHWQTFYSAWYGRKEDPGEAKDLSTLSDSARVFPDFVVRNSYKLILDEVLEFALKNPGRGVLVTGQPGVGKSLWRFYLLVCLLFRKQSVLFTYDNFNYLFHQGIVYVKKEDDIAWTHLPEPKSLSDSELVFIWSLINNGAQFQQVPQHLYSEYCFPVHTASPNPGRFSVWVKKRSPKLVGFSRWNEDELLAGFSVQKQYESFCADFKLYMGSKLASTFPTKLANEYQHQRAYGILQKWIDSSDLEGATSFTLEEALKALLNATSEEVGVAPRDVYEAIFSPDFIVRWHQSAISDITYDDLYKTVTELQKERSYPSSGSLTHRVISVYPAGDWDETGLQWEINFKSPIIANKALQRMEERERGRDVEMYQKLKNSQEGSALAGWLFESIANKRLASGNTSGLVLVPMVKGGTGDSPILSVDFSDANLTIVPFSAVKMEIIAFSGKSKNPMVLTNRLYKPEATNNPLFNAFYAHRTDNGSSVSFDLWVFQHTIARYHRGSDLGYPLIRKIIRGLENTVMNEVQNPSLSTKVHYVLVVPNGNEDDFWEWTMPEGYNAGTTFQDHRGDFYCLRLPLTVCCLNL
ncbi:hypothetical protein VKT23_007472 [Stygiomarasmius scandens]|uniref:Uncharacterized protein n=1 Tax=Marasmiellus scandens TaxID=2682957 RepID=A0ABR1JJY9_9AGAR